MRPVILSGIVCAAMISTPAAAAGQASPKAGGQAKVGSPTVRFQYFKPADSEQDALYDELRERKILEQFTEVLSAIRLPRPLTLRFGSCGKSNAWYDAKETTVTFCYEYVDDIVKLAASKDLGDVPLQEARDGPVVFVLLHETGHAVFDLLKVPIMGREEDAADIFAAVVLLRLGKGVALRTLRGAAWQYANLAKDEKVDQGDFADVHGLDAQRYYNLLCMAYGSDPEFFAAVVEKGRLPKDRAEGCADEYHAALYAMKKLIMPSIDVAEAKQLRAKNSKRWEEAPPPP